MSICDWPEIYLNDGELSEPTSEHESGAENIEPFRFEKAVKKWITQVFSYFLKKWQTHTLKAIRLGGHGSMIYVDCLDDSIEPETYLSNVSVSCNALKTLHVKTAHFGHLSRAIDDTELLELEIDPLWW